jgi:hypothetical protein
MHWTKAASSCERRVPGKYRDWALKKTFKYWFANLDLKFRQIAPLSGAFSRRRFRVSRPTALQARAQVVGDVQEEWMLLTVHAHCFSNSATWTYSGNVKWVQANTLNELGPSEQTSSGFNSTPQQHTYHLCVGINTADTKLQSWQYVHRAIESTCAFNHGYLPAPLFKFPVCSETSHTLALIVSISPY